MAVGCAGPFVLLGAEEVAMGLVLEMQATGKTAVGLRQLSWCPHVDSAT